MSDLTCARLWPAGRPVLVALSGGGDSLALLHLLLERGEQVQAAHLDHGLRPESASEVEWLRSHCQSRGIAFHSRRVDAHRLAERWGCGQEAAGRRARYRWLRKLAAQLGAVVCTAHTREDQAETLLMRLVQGCSIRGLRGIRTRWGQWLFRPLLECGREELRELLRQRGIRWLEDPTNLDTAHLRAWVRRELVPILRERNPRVEENLCKLARSADGEDYREAARLWRAADPQARLTRRHLAWLTGLKSGQRCTLPGGLTTSKDRSGLHFSATTSAAPVVPAPVRLPAQGKVKLVDWGMEVELDSDGHPSSGEPWSVVLKPEVAQPLSIRGRQEGDRFGRAKLKKVFNELGIEPHRRNAWPLLVDGEGRVIWIVGQRVRGEFVGQIDHGLRVTVIAITA